MPRERFELPTLSLPMICSTTELLWHYIPIDIFSVHYESAGRPEEIRKLKWKDVSFENKSVNLFSNKTKRAREIPINKSISWLEAWKKDYQFSDIKDLDYIFVSPDRTKPLSESFFTKLIKRLGVKAGIERVITPYWFRRSRLTEVYLKENVNDITHRKFAGHTEDSKMTSVYVAMDEKDMQDAIKSLYNVKLTKQQENDYEKRIKLLEQSNKRNKNNFEQMIKFIGNIIKKYPEFGDIPLDVEIIDNRRGKNKPLLKALS